MHLTVGRTYDITIPHGTKTIGHLKGEASSTIRVTLAMVDRDSAGNPAQVWVDVEGGGRSLLILEPGMTFTEALVQPPQPTYTVKDLGPDDRPAEELVAEATEQRGTGVAIGPQDKILPRKG